MDQLHVFCANGQTHDPKNTLPTVLHGCGAGYLVAGNGYFNCVPGIRDSQKYQKKILKHLGVAFCYQIHIQLKTFGRIKRKQL